MTAIEVKSPNSYNTNGYPTIFLGGVIDQGKADKWQDTVVERLKDLNVLILNPRRDIWDPTWVQSKDNPVFREQVEWELLAQERADLNLYVFASSEDTAKESRAPITFIELGLHAKEKHVLVCCPKGFYRKGNIDILCEKYYIQMFENLDQLIDETIELIKLI